MGQMGDAEKLTYQNQVLATWKQPKSSFRLDTKRLEKDHPDLAIQYQVEIQATRRLVIKNYQPKPILNQE
jgi:predicted phage-related endonuclease